MGVECVSPSPVSSHLANQQPTPPHLLDLLSGVPLRVLIAHNIQKNVEVNHPLPRRLPPRIRVVHELHDLLLLHVEAERAHEHLELVQVDGTCLVGVEQVVGLAQLLHLVVVELADGPAGLTELGGGEHGDGLLCCWGGGRFEH